MQRAFPALRWAVRTSSSDRHVERCPTLKQFGFFKCVQGGRLSYACYVFAVVVSALGAACPPEAPSITF